MKKLWVALKLLFLNPERFMRRARHEFLAPSNWFTRALRRVYSIFVPGKLTLANGNDDRLLFVYDTLLSPVTFDFLHYLYYADWLRHRAGKAHIDMLLVSRSNLASALEESYISAIGEDNLKWRLINLLIPLCRLFSSIGRIYIVDQEEAFEMVKRYRNVHPEGYCYASPKTAVVRLDAPGLCHFRSLITSATAQEIVEAYFPVADGRKIVTITLRTYDYISVRNSNVLSWVKFASGLDPLKYRVVFIPDASVDGVATFDQMKAFEIFDAACWNIELRAALYRRAWMNMGVTCGPLAISGLMEDVWTIMIDRSLDYPAYYLEGVGSNGTIPGSPPIFYSNSCHFYLGKDDEETILKIFKEYDRSDIKEDLCRIH